MVRSWMIAGLLMLTLPGLAGEITPKEAKPLLYPDPWTAAALEEMSTLANAEEICAAETGYYTALEALNDQSTQNYYRPWDFINYGGGCYVIRPAEGRFRAGGRIDYLFGPLAWGGPYVTYQDGMFQTGPTPYDEGSPLDPWGNPFYFFTPLGLVHGDDGTLGLELYGDAFARYTIVSLGPDGVMSGDDLAYQFGIGVSITALSSVRPAAPAGKVSGKAAAKAGNAAAATGYLQAGDGAILRGVNLGAASGGQVLFNGATLDTVTSWTTREIRLNLPASLGGQSGTLSVQRGTALTNALPVTIIGRVNGVKGWERFE